jgi:hypothetical protein
MTGARCTRPTVLGEVGALESPAIPTVGQVLDRVIEVQNHLLDPRADGRSDEVRIHHRNVLPGLVQ